MGGGGAPTRDSPEDLLPRYPSEHILGYEKNNEGKKINIRK
jgi:hypothetical protein